MNVDDKCLESFVNGIIEVDKQINLYNPDCIVVPLMGSLPFIDCLNIVNEDFDNELLEYIPASSKLVNMKKVMRTWFKNLLEENYFPNIKILSIDEVISGNSLKRVYKQFLNGKRDFLEERSIKYFKEINDKYIEKEDKEIDYKSIGIIDKTLQRGRENKEFKELIQEGVIIPIPVKRIITMDRPNFMPAKYKSEKLENGKRKFYPEVSSFDVSQEYLNFLSNFASYMGKDPNKVTVRNMSKILNSNRYLGV